MIHIIEKMLLMQGKMALVKMHILLRRFETYFTQCVDLIIIFNFILTKTFIAGM